MRKTWEFGGLSSSNLGFVGFFWLETEDWAHIPHDIGRTLLQLSHLAPIIPSQTEIALLLA
jgi:hypothetical protein